MQVIGKVNPDLSIKALTTLDLGTEVGEFWSKTLILFPLSSSISFQLLCFLSACLCGESTAWMAERSLALEMKRSPVNKRAPLWSNLALFHPCLAAHLLPSQILHELHC